MRFIIPVKFPVVLNYLVINVENERNHGKKRIRLPRVSPMKIQDKPELPALPLLEAPISSKQESPALQNTGTPVDALKKKRNRPVTKKPIKSARKVDADDKNFKDGDILRL
jgi:hypothetical protein